MNSNSNIKENSIKSNNLSKTTIVDQLNKRKCSKPSTPQSLSSIPTTSAAITSTSQNGLLSKKAESIISNSSKNNCSTETGEINTEEISKKLNELLKSSRFSVNDLKAMFDVSYQTMEDILYKPKSWSLLSQRIKIVYMKIANYFSNSNTETYLNDAVTNYDSESSYSTNSSYNNEELKKNRQRSTSFDDFNGKETKRRKMERVNNKTQPTIEYDVDGAQSKITNS